MFVRVTVSDAVVKPTPVAGKLSVEVGDRETPGGAMPMPLKAMVCARYSSETLSTPVAGPMVCGAKATAREQAECALSELPQELTTLKSPLVICAAIRARGRSPELVSVICWAVLAVVSGWAAKVSDDGESASVAGEVPMPVSVAVWVPASSVMERFPVRLPEAVGLNAMETVQPELGFRVAPQVFAVRMKSPVTVGG